MHGFTSVRGWCGTTLLAVLAENATVAAAAAAAAALIDRAVRGDT